MCKPLILLKLPGLSENTINPRLLYANSFTVVSSRSASFHHVYPGSNKIIIYTTQKLPAFSAPVIS